VTINVSSASKQHITFFYREPKDNLLASVEVASGAQVEIGHGWNAEQTDKVVQQLERFGARDAAEAHGKMRGKFLGLLYRVHGVISKDEIETGHAQVVTTQQERAASEATKAALGFDRSVNSSGKGRRNARMTEVIVEQLRAPGQRLTGDEVAMSIQVDPEGRSDVSLPL
jgi:hypothetical protein